MNEDFQGIDVYRSTVIVMESVIAASRNENRYFLSEKRHGEVSSLEAGVDWTVNHGRRVKEQVHLNLDYIMQYVDEHRDEIKLKDGILSFTDEQFRYFMGNKIREDIRISRNPVLVR